MERLSDGLLVGEALAGRKEAFDQLVRRYQTCAYATAVSLLPDVDLAQDVVQEAFLEAYLRLPCLLNRERFAGWLRGIVRNMSHRARRELHRVKELSQQAPADAEPTDPAPLPHGQFERAEERDRVQQALGRLNETNREAICLHYLDELSYAEIAAFLGTTEATVLGRLQRGRRELRKELSMAEDFLRDSRLPQDFAVQVSRLLDRAASMGEGGQIIDELAALGGPAVGPLSRATGDSRAVVRRVAAHALCRIGDPRALAPMLRLLYIKSPWSHPWVRNLIESGRMLAIPGLREELIAIAAGERPHEERSWPIRALAHAYGDQEAAECLLRVFRSTDPQSPTALVALCHLRPDLAADLLVEALQQTEQPRLRWMAAEYAGREGIPLPIDTCLGAFRSDTNWWGRMWAGRLVLLHGEPGARVLQDTMESGTPAEQETAALALAPARDPLAFTILTRAVLEQHCDHNWPMTIAHSVALYYPRELSDWLQADGERARRQPELAWAFARHPSAAAETLAESWYRGGTPLLRAAAIRILTHLRGSGFLPELRRTLRECRPRKASDEAYRQMLGMGEAAHATAREMLESSHWTERRAAVGLLRHWGLLAADQQEHAQGDSHIAVRLAAE